MSRNGGQHPQPPFVGGREEKKRQQYGIGSPYDRAVGRGNSKAETKRRRNVISARNQKTSEREPGPSVIKQITDIGQIPRLRRNGSRHSFTSAVV